MRAAHLEAESPRPESDHRGEPEAGPYELVLELSRADSPEDAHDFHQGQRDYLVREGEGGVKRASLPWGELMGDLAALTGGRPDGEIARRLGERMRRFLDVLDWGGQEERLEQGRWKGRQLRLVMRSSAAELYSLPWELVTLEGSGRHLADVPGCTLRYEWPGEREEGARGEAAHEGRVLLAWSEAGGGVPEDKHLRALEKASREGGFAFDSRRDVLPRVSLESLDKKLREAREAQEPVSVLHVLCHGAPLETSGPGHHGLAWNAPEARGGTRELVDGVALGAVLTPYADTLRMVVLCACHGGDGGRLASYLGSVAQELHRAGIDMVVASRLPLSMEGSVLLAETLYEKLLVDSSSLEEALGAVRRRLRVETKGFDWASLQLYARREGEADLRPVVLRPYRGLLAFGPKDRRFFFGRGRLEAKLLGRVTQAARGQRPRFQVVAGASGAGKSSVVMAGLVPQLPREEWDSVVVRPGELVRTRPAAVEGRSVALLELQHRLHRLWDHETPPTGESANLLEVVEEVRRLRQARPERKLLLVVDQLEEVFTQLGSEERQALMRAVWALAREPELGCVVVVTLRVDHFERCGEVVLDEQTRLDTVVYAEEHRLFVAQMSPEELTEAIEKPAHAVGLELEAGLVERLCGDVGQEPGALPLLEHALDLLWRRREGRRLTHRAYEEMDGVAGSLTQTAERLYEALREEERQEVRRLLAELVSLGDETRPDSRRRAWLEEVWPEEKEARAALDRVLEKVVAERLVTRGSETEGGGRAWVEVAHEALIRRWERLRKWLQENRKRLLQWRELQAMAEAWQGHRKDADRGESYLATGARLGYARSIRSEHLGQLTASVREFLEASEARERRRVRRQWCVGAALAVGMVVFAGLALYASRQRAMAVHRLEEAVSLARQIHFVTSKKLGPIAGTAAVRKELLQGVEGLLKSLEATDEPDIQLESIRNHLQRGDVAMSHENTVSASEEYGRALAIIERLLASDPDEPIYKQELAVIHSNLGDVAQTQGQLAEARGHYEKALALSQELSEAEPTSATLKQGLTIGYNRLGKVAQAQDQLAEARGHYEKALALSRELSEAEPANATLKRSLAVNHDKLGEVAQARNQLTEAREHYEKALALSRELSEAEPTNATLKWGLSVSYSKLGKVAQAQDQLAEAREQYGKALALSRELSEADPTNARLKRGLAINYGRLGKVAHEQGHLEDARRHYAKDLELSRELSEADPTNATLKRGLVINYNRLGEVARAQGRLEEARGHYEKSLALNRELSEADPTNATLKRDLTASYSRLEQVK
ncbi:nSTAND1 domain-containing NTPase [Archangium lipolyticum]|uniref:nSTAND1 domain-containing NTPase n=1 Tax=Archangium lipolyticum TaxID=2970465 RepID=UPI0027D44FB5|nr:tetratricopeptide repeat protein [Archangium lipolyticum]